MRASFVEYGRRVERMVGEIKAGLGKANSLK
jgi:hypothetical protein